MEVLRKLSKDGNLAKFLKQLYETGKIKVLSSEDSDKINRMLAADIEKAKDKFNSLSLRTQKKFR